ncbi:F-box protein SKIP23-like [Panicum hallii]|uniref:F-box protein SKIP23-like n=1 Tax=Panicum hallii TaxID=206008 RepID=UPI000BC2AC05|nr:F-box protein SKIP23-like [Panicum hallii]
MTTADPPLARVTDWAGLPGDLRACVRELLTAVPGRVCFRAVCRSWRAADGPHPVPRMPPPWLVLPLGTVGCSDAFTLLSVPTMQAFRWSPPGGAGLFGVGSSGGWIAGAYIDADLKIRLSLLNPLTDARVDVPAPFGRVYHMPSGRRSATEEISLCNTFQKVAFSPSPTEHDFAVAVVTRSRSGKAMAFARAGCNEVWLADLGPFERGGDYIRAQRDVAYHDGKFYYMTMSGQVWVVDMAAPFATFEPTMPGLIKRRHHLAFTGDGALHIVCSSIRELHSSDGNMLALRYAPSCTAEQGSSSSTWAQVTCLHGQAFLIGDLNQTLSVHADGDDGAWLRPDCVYFTNIPLCSLLAQSRDCSYGRAWVLYLATGDIRRPDSATGEPRNYKVETHWAQRYPKCVWIMPSMR